MSREASTTESRIVVDHANALTSGINKNRLYPLISDFLLICVLGAMIVLESYTDAINATDIRIMATLTAIFLAALVLFNVTKRKNVYTRYLVIISLALACVSLLMVNSLFGNHGSEIHDGSLPWALPFYPIVILYVCTFLIDRHAKKFLFVFVGANTLFLVIYVLDITPEKKPAIIAIVWIFGVVMIGSIITAGLLQMQRKIHGETIRNMLAVQAETRIRHEAQSAALNIDRETNVLNLDGVLSSLKEIPDGSGKMLCVVMPDQQKCMEALGISGFNAYCKEISVILSNLLGENITVGRPFEHVFLAWTTGWSVEELLKQKRFVSLMMRPIWHEQVEITPVIFTANIGSDLNNMSRDRLLQMTDVEVHSGVTE